MDQCSGSIDNGLTHNIVFSTSGDQTVRLNHPNLK